MAGKDKDKMRGRPPIGGQSMEANIFIRCTAAQKQALHDYVAKVNVQRAKKGLAPIDMSIWIREVILQKSGNGHLGLAAMARAHAESISSIL